MCALGRASIKLKACSLFRKKTRDGALEKNGDIFEKLELLNISKNIMKYLKGRFPLGVFLLAGGKILRFFFNLIGQIGLNPAFCGSFVRRIRRTKLRIFNLGTFVHDVRPRRSFTTGNSNKRSLWSANKTIEVERGLWGSDSYWNEFELLLYIKYINTNQAGKVIIRNRSISPE